MPPINPHTCRAGPADRPDAGGIALIERGELFKEPFQRRGRGCGIRAVGHDREAAPRIEMCEQHLDGLSRAVAAFADDQMDVAAKAGRTAGEIAGRARVQAESVPNPGLALHVQRRMRISETHREPPF